MPRENTAGSPLGWLGRRSATSPYQPEGEPLLLNAAPLSQIPTQFGGMAIRAQVWRTGARLRPNPGAPATGPHQQHAPPQQQARGARAEQQRPAQGLTDPRLLLAERADDH